MEGIGTLIAICFSITFAPPIVFFIIGLIKRKSEKGKVFFILAAVWFIVGGGICASILSGA